MMRIAGTIFAFSAVAHAADVPSAGRSWVVIHEDGSRALTEGRFDDALAQFRSALSISDTPVRRAATLNDIGNSLRGEGRNDEASAVLEQALAAWVAIDATGAHAAESAVSLAGAQRAHLRFGDAERTLRAELGRNPGDAAAIASLSNLLGDLLREQDRLAEAGQLFETALKLSPPPAEWNRVNALLGLADVERAESDWRESIAHWSSAIALARELRLPAGEALGLRGLGKTYLDKGDLANAEPLIRRAIAISDSAPAMRVNAGAALDYLGQLYREEKKYALAEDAFSRALAIQGGDGAKTPAAAVTLEQLAGLMALDKRFDEAAEDARRAEAIIRAAFPADAPPLAGALSAKAFVEGYSGDPAGAERDYAEALRLLRRNGVADTVMGMDLMSQYAAVLKRLHRAKDAKPLDAEVKAFRQSSP